MEHIGVRSILMRAGRQRQPHAFATLQQTFVFVVFAERWLRAGRRHLLQPVLELEAVQQLHLPRRHALPGLHPRGHHLHLHSHRRAGEALARLFDFIRLNSHG